MIDIKSLLERIEELEMNGIDKDNRIKALEIALFKKIVEVDQLNEKLDSLGVLA